MSANRRIETRARQLQRARIVTNRGFTALDCVVLDISESGAKLKVPSTFGIPDCFELRIGTQTPRQVKVRHRTFDSLGVEFTD